jgi:hypothetical protein
MKNSNGEVDILDKTNEIPLRKQLSVVGRVLLICTSILFWVVGNTLPESESVLRFMSKLVSVLSIANYATWTGERGWIGFFDYIAVHVSVVIFCFRIWGKPSFFLANWFGVLCTFYAWKGKTRAEQQLLVHLIALFNIFLFGILLQYK